MLEILTIFFYQTLGAGASAGASSGGGRQPIIIPIPKKEPDLPPLVIPIPYSAGPKTPTYQPIYVPHQGPKGDESPIVIPIPGATPPRKLKRFYINVF